MNERPDYARLAPQAPSNGAEAVLEFPVFKSAPGIQTGATRRKQEGSGKNLSVQSVTFCFSFVKTNASVNSKRLQG